LVEQVVALRVLPASASTRVHRPVHFSDQGAV
jgi:hypothetical protein